VTSYLLGTNILSHLIDNPKGPGEKRLAHLRGNPICTSIVAAAELRYGAIRKQSPRL
jgi:tRNA(fMet)-specific endonuclease VapC